MDTLSVWRGTTSAAGFGALQGDASTDVLIIGGGITGLTLALLLAQQGRQVTVLEAQEIASGSTGNSTGNLYVTLSQGLHGVLSRWGEDVLRQVVTERGAAIDFIERQAQQGADFGFRRCPLVRYAQSSQYQQQVDEEFEALAKAGCSPDRRKEVPEGLPRPAGDVLLLPGQAQFQPAAYVQHLARQAAQAGVRIHEHSRVIDIDHRARRASTETGTVQAQELVMATHTPKGIRMVHAEMPVHREYGVALRMPFTDPGPGIFWAKGDASMSVRTLDAGGERFLICAGQEHKVGLHNAKASLMALEQQLQQHFGNGPVAYRWSAQNYRGADHLPYIGRDSTGCFIATGFATDGLTWGTVAARLISEELAGRSPALGQLCKPLRLSPIKGGKAILEENVAVVKQLVQDYLTDRQREQLNRLAPGNAAIADLDGERVAAYRAHDGKLFAVSPVCTHLKCIVHWNPVETSWDCPCHGSRFQPDGSVIEGPALTPLARKLVRVGGGQP
jgi:glycine/D-amino acid oxidase-like deaminating enzyme/nitrite reductase/ring-hydroxylating ferredoxin subunit